MSFYRVPSHFFLVTALSLVTLTASRVGSAQSVPDSPANASPQAGLANPASHAVALIEKEQAKVKAMEAWTHQFTQYERWMQILDQVRGEIEEGKSHDPTHFLDVCTARGVSRGAGEIIQLVLLDAYDRRKELGVQFVAANGNGLQPFSSKSDMDEYSGKQLRMTYDQEVVTHEAISRIMQQLGPQDFKRFDGSLQDDQNWFQAHTAAVHVTTNAGKTDAGVTLK